MTYYLDSPPPYSSDSFLSTERPPSSTSNLQFLLLLPIIMMVAIPIICIFFMRLLNYSSPKEVKDFISLFIKMSTSDQKIFIDLFCVVSWKEGVHKNLLQDSSRGEVENFLSRLSRGSQEQIEIRSRGLGGLSRKERGVLINLFLCMPQEERREFVSRFATSDEEMHCLLSPLIKIQQKQRIDFMKNFGNMSGQERRDLINFLFGNELELNLSFMRCFLKMPHREGRVLIELLRYTSLKTKEVFLKHFTQTRQDKAEMFMKNFIHVCASPEHKQSFASHLNIISQEQDFLIAQLLNESSESKIRDCVRQGGPPAYIQTAPPAYHESVNIIDHPTAESQSSLCAGRSPEYRGVTNLEQELPQIASTSLSSYEDIFYSAERRSHIRTYEPIVLT